jgi:hypothetical protein
MKTFLFNAPKEKKHTSSVFEEMRINLSLQRFERGETYLFGLRSMEINFLFDTSKEKRC